MIKKVAKHFGLLVICPSYKLPYKPSLAPSFLPSQALKVTIRRRDDVRETCNSESVDRIPFLAPSFKLTHIGVFHQRARRREESMTNWHGTSTHIFHYERCRLKSPSYCDRTTSPLYFLLCHHSAHAIACVGDGLGETMVVGGLCLDFISF